MTKSCYTCTYYRENHDACSNPRNRDGLLASRQRTYSRISRIWYNSCGKAGSWYEAMLIVPKVAEVLKYSNGLYAVRRERTPNIFSKKNKYEFLGITCTISDRIPDTWWGEEHKTQYCLGTLDQVRTKLDTLNAQTEIANDSYEVI